MPEPTPRGEVSEVDGGGFVRGTYSRGLSMYARRTNGKEVRISSFMPRLNVWKATAAGRAYYGHNRVQFIVNVPAVAYKWNENQGRYIKLTISGLLGGVPLRRMIPIDREDVTQAPDTDGDLVAA